MLRVKKITGVIGKKVYTDTGDFFGEIEEANLGDNKIDGWKIKVGGSVIPLISGAKGVIIPHSLVKSIGTIVIISKAAIPSDEEEETVAA